jgi:hypothetical protein
MEEFNGMTAQEINQSLRAPGQPERSDLLGSIKTWVFCAAREAEKANAWEDDECPAAKAAYARQNKYTLMAAQCAWAQNMLYEN